MSSRFPVRIRILFHAMIHWLATLGRRHRPPSPKRILLAHNLLLGDTLMLTPLLAKLRANYPAAEIVMTVAPGLMGLYRSQPYGVRTVIYSPYDIDAARALLRNEKGFDLAIVPGDNRHALLALALDARWIVAFAGDHPKWKNRLCDQLIPFPEQGLAVADLFALLAEGEWDDVYFPEDWPPAQNSAQLTPAAPFAVLHVGAGNPLRLWHPEKWRTIAGKLQEAGIKPVFSCGPGEQHLIYDIDPDEVYPSYPGNLKLEELRQLLAQSSLLICLDSGISHLAKITRTPTVVIYGPGSPALFGTGKFWRENPFRSVWITNISCRDQRQMFRRTPQWVQRCGRTPAQCHDANRCMTSIPVDDVWAAALSLLSR